MKRAGQCSKINIIILKTQFLSVAANLHRLIRLYATISAIRPNVGRTGRAISTWLLKLICWLESVWNGGVEPLTIKQIGYTFYTMKMETYIFDLCMYVCFFTHSKPARIFNFFEVVRYGSFWTKSPSTGKGGRSIYGITRERPRKRPRTALT